MREANTAATVERAPAVQDVIVTVLRRPRHPALVARVLTAGLSAAAAFAMIAVMGRHSTSDATAPASERTVEVRIGAEVDEADARAALGAWLEGRPDLARDGAVTIVDAPPDTTSAPS